MFNFFATKFSQMLSGISKLWNPDAKKQLMLELKKILLEADVPLKMVEEFSLNVVSNFETQLQKAPKLNKQELLKVALYKELIKALGQDCNPLADWPKRGTFLFMGLQGAGKTTTIAKIGHWLASKHNVCPQKILCTSLDFMRPAAIEQLRLMCLKANLNFIAPVNSSISATIELGMKHKAAIPEGFLLIDTAGRLNVDQELMIELTEICQQAKPDLKILVLDSMTGQKSISVAEDFQRTVGIDRSILTKMDSDARGGCALALRQITKVPVSFAATGEKIDDLEPFIASRIASRIVDSGDMDSLMERLESQIKQMSLNESDMNAVATRMMNGTLTLQDFLFQIDTMSSLGSLNKIASYIPGFGAMKAEEIEKTERQTKVFKALLQSMTPKERLNHKILTPARRERICRGAGRKMIDLQMLLEKFEETKHFAKMFNRLRR